MTENQRNTESLSLRDRMQQDPNLRLREVVTAIAQIREGIPTDVYHSLPRIEGRLLADRLGEAIQVVVWAHILSHVRNLPQRSLQVGEGVLLDINGDGYPTFRRHEHRSGSHDNYFDGWVGVHPYRYYPWLDNYQGILDRVTELE